MTVPADVAALVRAGLLEEVQPGLFRRPRLPSRAEVSGATESWALAGVNVATAGPGGRRRHPALLPSQAPWGRETWPPPRRATSG